MLLIGKPSISMGHGTTMAMLNNYRVLVKHMVADYHVIYLIHSNNVIVMRIEWQQHDSARSHDSKGN